MWELPTIWLLLCTASAGANPLPWDKKERHAGFGLVKSAWEVAMMPLR